MDSLDIGDAEMSNEIVTSCLETVLRKTKEETKIVEENSRFLTEQSQVILAEVTDKSNGVRLSSPMPKLYRDKYAIWFEVENPGHKDFKDFYFSLRWNSTDELTYVSSMHSDITKETKLNDQFVYHEDRLWKHLLVIVINRPIFLKELSIEIDGILNYCDEKGKQYIEEIPTIKLRTQDVTDVEVNVPPLQEDKSIINFYSRLVCSFKADLVIQLQPGRSIGSSLEEAHLISSDPQPVEPTRFYAIFDKSTLFDGTIVEVAFDETMTDIIDVSVYTKDDDSLLAFCHHLYQSIKPLCILPSEYKMRLLAVRDSKNEKHLAECIKEEIRILRSLCIPSKLGEYKKTRSQLAKCELKTDLAFVAFRIANDRRVSSVGSGDGVEFMEE